MKERCVVNFASRGRSNYLIGSQRLFNSMNYNNVEADLLICSPDFPSNEDIEIDGRMLYKRNRYPQSKEYGLCPEHKDAPYAFKTYIIQEARDMGYEKIMWADSSCIFLNDTEKYWKLAEEIGVVLFDNPGCPEATWTSDDCLEHMGCSVEFARTFFEIDAFVMLFDFSLPIADPALWKRFGYDENSKPVAHRFFDKYFEHSRDGICLKGVGGSLRPDFKAHRHDQSIASYWARVFNILPINYGGWCYAHEVGTKFNPTFVKAGIEQLFNWYLIVDMHREGKSIMGVSFL